MSLALLIASLVASAIGTIPSIPAALKTAISAISATLGVLIKNDIGVAGTPTTVSLILATLQEVVVQLKSVEGLSGSVLADIAVLDNALTAAVAANTAAGQKVDPTQLQPIAPVS